MSKKFKKFMATVLILSQVLTCNAFSVMAQDVNFVSSGSENITEQKNYYEEEEMQIVDEDEKESEVDTSHDFDLLNNINDDEVVESTNNNNIKNNWIVYDEEPEIDENKEENNEEEEKLETETSVEDFDKEEDKEIEDNLETKTINNNDISEEDEEKNIEIELNEEKSENIENNRNTINIEAEISEEESTSSEHAEEIGIEKIAEIEKVKIDVTARTSELEEDEEFVFSENDFVGIDVSSKANDDEDIIENNDFDTELLGASETKYIWFGRYPQNDVTGEQLEPIKWLHLGQRHGKDVYVTEKILDNKKFHNDSAGVPSSAWKNSDIRNWLCDTFKQDAFSLQQQGKLLAFTNDTTQDADINGEFIFLLSYNDTVKYFGSNTERKANTTPYADNLYVKATKKPSESGYWIRRIVNSGSSAGYVSKDGSNGKYTQSNKEGFGVRPAAIIPDMMFSNNSVEWDLNGGNWREESKLWGQMDSYQLGQELPGKTNIIPPSGQDFDGWKVIKKSTGEVITDGAIRLSAANGNIKLVAKYKDKEKIVDKIILGEWKLQEGSDEKQPIEWKRIPYQYGSDEDIIYFISTRPVGALPFDNSLYSDSTYRTFLSQDFYNGAFNDAEKNFLQIGTYINYANVDSTTQRMDAISRGTAGDKVTMPLAMKAYRLPYIVPLYNVYEKGVKFPNVYPAMSVLGSEYTPSSLDTGYDVNMYATSMTSEDGGLYVYYSDGDVQKIKSSDKKLGIQAVIALNKGDLNKIKDLNPTLNMEYALDGGKFVGVAPKEFSKATVLRLPNNVEKSGFVFDGWYTKANGEGEKVTYVGGEYGLDITKVYAKWISDNGSLTIKTYNGYGKNGKEYYYEGEGFSGGIIKQYNTSYSAKIKAPTVEESPKIEGFRLVSFGRQRITFNLDETVIRREWEPGTEKAIVDFGYNVGDTVETFYPLYEEMEYTLEIKVPSVKLDSGTTYTDNTTYTQKAYYTQKFSEFTYDKALPEGYDYHFDFNSKSTTPEYEKFSNVETPEELIKKGVVFDKNNKATIYLIVRKDLYDLKFNGGSIVASDGVEYFAPNEIDRKVYNRRDRITPPVCEIDDDFTLKGFTIDMEGKWLGAGDDDDYIWAWNNWPLGQKRFIRDIDFEDWETEDIFVDLWDKYSFGTYSMNRYTSWEEKKGKVTFIGGSKEGSDGKTHTLNKSVSVEQGYKSVAAPPDDFELTGFKIKGFANPSSPLDAIINVADEPKIGDIIRTYGDSAAHRATLSAIWVENEYKIAFEPGGKVVAGKTYEATSSDVEAKLYKYHSKIPMPSTSSVTMYGFKLLGFSKEEDATSAKYKPGEEVKVADVVSYLDMTEYLGEGDTATNVLYAVWEIDDATVTFDADNGYFDSNNKRTKTLKLNKPGKALKDYTHYEEPKTIDGFAFDYWTDDDGNKLTKDSVVVGDRKLKANYKKTGTGGISKEDYKKLHVIKIVNDDTKGTVKINGAVPSNMAFAINKGDKVLAAIASNSITIDEKTGWNFWGWSFTDEIENIIDKNTTYTDTDDVTLYTQYYEEKEFTVILDANTGLFSDNKTTKTLKSKKWIKLNEFTNYEEPEKSDGYTFNAWIGEDKKEISKNAIIKATSSNPIKLYATYKNPSGDIIGEDPDTGNGGKDASYTIRLASVATKGQLGKVEKIELKIDDNILNEMNTQGVTNPQIVDKKFFFGGWTFENTYETIITSADKYTDSTKRVLNAFYLETNVKVVLDANTGMFESNYSRVKTLIASGSTMLKDFANYETPEKSDGYTFKRWVDDKGNTVGEDTRIFNNTNLKAVYEYKDSGTGTTIEIGKDDDTSDGGKDATYTVTISNDTTRGTIGTVTKFEIKKDAKILETMRNKSVQMTPTEIDPWLFWGWAFTDKLADKLKESDIYNDTEKTKLYSIYYAKGEFPIILDANTGLFSNNETVKVIKSERIATLNEIEGYEIPQKSEGYTFNGWVDENIKAVSEDTLMYNKNAATRLYATYKDPSGKIIGGDSDTSDGGKDASYTIRLVSVATRGEIGKVKSFELKIGDVVMTKMYDAGVGNPRAIEPNRFLGWSFDDKYETALTITTTYEDSSKRLLHALYTINVYTITLKANTGLFSNNQREKTFDVWQYSLLVGNSAYEVPRKADGYKFDRWERDGVAITNINEFIVEEDMTLVAIYKNGDGKEIGKTDDTEDGGKDASYTMSVINDDTKGTYDGTKYFEIKMNDNIMYTMETAGVKEGVGLDGYLFQGFALNGERLVNRTDTFNDTNITSLYITYVSDLYSSNLTLDAWAGTFADGNKYRRYSNIAAGRIINTLPGYEEPVMDGWMFSRWIDEDGYTVDTRTAIRSGNIVLSAVYRDESGNEIGHRFHKHYVCGATTVCAHTDGVLRNHSFANSYIAVSNGANIKRLVDIELAKSVSDRNNVYIFLLNDVVIPENIELDTNVKLYICLNGYNLNTKKILAKVGSINSEVIITNCKDTNVEIVEAATEENTAMFGNNGIHVFGNESTITLKPQGSLVNTKGETSDTDKEVVLYKVDVDGGVAKDTEFISIEGNSNVKLVDVNIKNVVSEKAVVKVDSSAKLLIGNEVNVNHCQSDKAIIDSDGVVNVVSSSKFTGSNNTINKKENGENGIVLLGNVNNYISGDFIVSGNKLNITDEYLTALTAKDKEEENNIGILGSIFNALFGSFAEEESPVGDVGYTAAVLLKNTNTTIEVRDSKIVVADNESSDNAKDMRAGYMYNVLSKDEVAPIFNQVKGTNLKSDSNIGVAFATSEGEGNITYNKEANDGIFKNTTFGKEEKILDVKENSMGIGIERKTYYVEYDEGAAITNESKTKIQTYTNEGEETTEEKRLRTEAIKAGKDVVLNDNTIYNAKGFDLATYSIVRPSSKNKGEFIPKATISYLDDIFDENDEIKDGEVIKAVANWSEKKLNSEAKEVVISKEVYNQMLEEAANEAAEVASYSEAEQVTVDDGKEYYTVRYWLDGGWFDGSEKPETGYADDTTANRNKKYTLLTDVVKGATVSEVYVTEDFVGWSIKDEEAIITEIEEGFEGEMVEVVANYKPSTYKITYHLNDGNLNGNTEDVVDTVVRKSDYVLIKNIDKEGFSFAGWTKENAEISKDNPIIEEIESETLEGDIEVYAQYSSIYYSVTYHLEGGKLNGIDTVDDVYVDDTADRTQDYHMFDEVTKEGFDFLGWVTVDGEIPIDTIEANDKDMTKREVKAYYRSITYTVNYDTDGGVISGALSNVANPEEGEIYILYTDVVKEGFEFLGWYDEKTGSQVVSIGNAQVGEVYNVKARWAKLTYDLTLHFRTAYAKFLSEGVPEDYTITNIDNKVDYVLPTYKEVTLLGNELQDWYYIKDGVKTSITTIKAGNPENITDVYARWDDLDTHIVYYHLRRIGADEWLDINGIDDSEYTDYERVYKRYVNRREDYFIPEKGKCEGMDFIGWTEGKRVEYVDLSNYDKDLFKTIKPGVTREQEENEPGLRNKEFHYYAYFVPTPKKYAKVAYVLNYGYLPFKMNKTMENKTLELDVSIENKYYLDTYVVRDNYEFRGWYRDEECEKFPVTEIDVEELKNAEETIKVYAKWERHKYKLTYYVNGGTMLGKELTEGNTVYRVELDHDKATILDRNIERAGYRFDGWYDKYLGDEISFIEMGCLKNIDVVARWTKNTYTVTYELEGGKVEGVNGNIHKVTYSSDDNNTLITNVEKAGHKFLGWYTERNGQGDKIEVIEKSEKIIEDTTLYAYFEDMRYKVTYKLEGGLLKGKKLDKDGNYVETYDGTKEAVLYDESRVSRGYDKFLYWTNEDGKPVSSVEEGHKGDIILTAHYKIAMVELTYHFDGGFLPSLTTMFDKISSYKVRYNSLKDYKLIDKVESKPNGFGIQELVFTGWETKDGEPIDMIPAESEGITDIYATWKNGAYQIHYYLDGGKIGTTEASKYTGYIAVGSNDFRDTVLATNVTKTNNVFLGWYSNPQFTGEPVTVIPKFSPDRVDFVLPFYAKWEQTHYTLTYNVGDGKFIKADTIGNTVKLKVENKYPYVLIDEEEVALDGYEFDGWYKVDEDGEFVGDRIVWIDIDNKDNYDLYAKFVDVDEMDEDEKEAFKKSKEERKAEKKIAKEKVDKIINENIEKTKQETKNNIKTVSDKIINKYIEEDKNRNNDNIETYKSSKQSFLGAVANFFTSIFGNSEDTKLLGDDEEGTKIEEDDSSESIVEINTSSLNAYDSVSAKNLGVKEKEGYELQSFILTYIETSSGTDIDDSEFIGKVYEKGSNFADVADKYPNSIIGGRVVFIDSSVLPKNETPSGDTPRGSGTSPGGSGGGGAAAGTVQTANNGVPIIDDDSTYGSSIGQVIVNGVVNPYGFSGRGNDNGAMNVAMNSVNLVEAVNKYQTYATVDLSNTKFQDLQKLGEGYFEYFPASNGYKYFYLNKLGVRTYVRNGWNYVKTQSGYRWLMFDSDGMMMRGFVNYKGNTYYLRNSLDGIAYMMTGFVEWKKVGIVAYFNENGALQNIFSKEEASKFMQVNAISSQVNFSVELLTKVILYDREFNVISKTVKTVGSTALGNFVGYWYYFKDGRKRFRFETINKNLQMSKFAKNGWITVFDDKFKESSYKFAANGDLIVNTKTEEGIEVDAIGQAKVNNTVTKLNIITKPIDTNFVKGAEVDRYYEVNVSTADMVSKEVDDRGITKDITKATRVFTTTQLENELVALNQTKK